MQSNDKPQVCLITIWADAMLPAIAVGKLQQTVGRQINAIDTAAMAYDIQVQQLLQQLHSGVIDLLRATSCNISFASSDFVNEELMQWLLDWQQKQWTTISYVLIDSHIQMLAMVQNPSLQIPEFIGQLNTNNAAAQVATKYNCMPLNSRAHLVDNLRNLQQQAIVRGYGQHVLDWPWFAVMNKYSTLLDA